MTGMLESAHECTLIAGGSATLAAVAENPVAVVFAGSSSGTAWYSVLHSWRAFRASSVASVGGFQIQHTFYCMLV